MLTATPLLQILTGETGESSLPTFVLPSVPTETSIDQDAPGSGTSAPPSDQS